MVDLAVSSIVDPVLSTIVADLSTDVTSDEVWSTAVLTAIGTRSTSGAATEKLLFGKRRRTKRMKRDEMKRVCWERRNERGVGKPMEKHYHTLCTTS